VRLLLFLLVVFETKFPLLFQCTGQCTVVTVSVQESMFGRYCFSARVNVRPLLFHCTSQCAAVTVSVHESMCGSLLFMCTSQCASVTVSVHESMCGPMMCSGNGNCSLNDDMSGYSCICNPGFYGEGCDGKVK